MVVQSTE